MVRLSDVRDPKEMAEIGRSNEEMSEYFANMLADRRRSPQDDLMTGLSQAEVAGAKLTESDIVMLARTILVAGNETTRNLMSGAVAALSRFPGERKKLVEEPEMMANAVDGLKQRGWHVTGHQDDGGLAEAIRKFALGSPRGREF